MAASRNDRVISPVFGVEPEVLEAATRNEHAARRRSAAPSSSRRERRYDKTEGAHGGTVSSPVSNRGGQIRTADL